MNRDQDIFRLFSNSPFYRVTIAHQHEIATDDNFSTSYPVNMKLDSSNQVVDDEQFNQLLARTGQWPTDLPVEDLTGEVQDLMMRYTRKKFSLSCNPNFNSIFFSAQTENQ